MSVVETFLKLVQIDSPSLKEGGIALYVKNYLSKIGFTVYVDNANERFGGNSGNVIASLSAESKGPTILFNAHLDTVDPCIGAKPRQYGGIIRTDGKTVLGGDNKAGVSIILQAARCIVENKLPHGPIEIVLTVAEEKGLLGSKNLCFDDINADLAFVLDAEGNAGGLIVRAPSQDSIRASFKGKSAHAGVDPEKGINSIQAAAKAISCMKLGRLDFETTANMGTIKGGLAPNIVPQETVVEGEARSHSMDKLKAQTKHLVECLYKGAQDIGATVNIDVSRAYESFSLTEDNQAVQIAIDAIKSLGIKPDLGATGGGSDANVFNKAGIPAVNLSVGEEAVHSVEEKIAVANLETGVEIVIKIAEQALKRKR